MANMNIDGLDGLLESFAALADLPDEVVEAMLDAEAAVVLPAERAEAEKLGMYDGYDHHGNFRDTSEINSLPGQTKSYSTGELARSLKTGKLKIVKGKRTKSIYFSGTRKRGKTRTRNAEIAFLNEFGTRTINARHFVRIAVQKSADSAVTAAAKVMDEFLEKNNL